MSGGDAEGGDRLRCGVEGRPAHQDWSPGPPGGPRAARRPRESGKGGAADRHGGILVAGQGHEVTGGPGRPHEVVLHDEEVVTNKRVEPKERVRLDTDEVVEQQSVEADLRKERIDVESDAEPRRR